MDPFATVEELVKRLDWQLDENELAHAAEALDDASELIRAEAGRSWTPENAPRVVKRLTLKIVARYMRNPDGYEQSRAGDETVIWGDKGGDAEGVYLTESERQMLRRLVRPSGLASAWVSAWGHQERPTPHLAPVWDGSKPFPYAARPEYL